MALAGQQHTQQRKDLELVFSLQSHYKHFFKNYGDIVGVYDIPSITMQWESFKSYLLKNSGIMFDNITPPPASSPCSTNTSQPNQMDDIQIRYANTAGLELPINNQDDFQYALYSFRERARIGEINHLKLTRVKGIGAAPINATACDNNSSVVVEVASSGVRAEIGRTRNTSGGDGLELGQVVAGKDEEKPPEWFSKYMKKFKQEIILEVTKVNAAQMSSNLKKMQAANHVACPKRRQNKSEHYKRRPKMTYANNIATENTSCDNTDVNTIATTPTLTNPQTSTLTPPKLLNAQTRNKHNLTPPQTKPDNVNKQIKLKAKRLATSNNTNARGSSDSDTLTVIKQTAGKTDTKCHESRLKYRENAALKKKPTDIRVDYKTLDQSRRFSAVESGESAYCVALPTDLIYENCIPPKRIIETPLSTQYKLKNATHNASSRYINTEHNYSSAMEPNNHESAGATSPPDFPWEFRTKKVNAGLDVLRKYKAEVVEEDQCWCADKAELVDSYVKKWRIRNTGERNFDSKTTLRFTWGSLFPIIPWAECPFLQPDESGWLSVSVKIPERVGSYECHWRLYQGGERFGPWLGFRLDVTAPNRSGDHSDIVSRVRITSLFPPKQHIAPTLLDRKVEQNCDDSSDTKEAVDVDDVVAVIQGMVVRADGIDKPSDDLSQCKLPVVPTLAAKLFAPTFKENEQISTDDQDELFINAPDHNMRYTIEKQINKPLQMHTDSDNDEGDSDEDDNDNDDINVGKDLVMVDIHHVQDNSDSDNVSIVSIAESNQSNRSVAATNISIAGSFSSGNGSASEEFVVIPMPKWSSLTLSDGDDNSCPELEPTPAQLSAQKRTQAGLANTVAIALKQKQQHIKQANLRTQRKLLLDKLDGNRSLLRKNCDDAEADVKTGFEAGYSRADEVVINFDDFDFDRPPTADEQQTCPVDLSTNNTLKGSFVSYNSTDPGRKMSQIFGENKPHCAAIWCDLCINTMLKNKHENAKNRLFVFPADSPGFEAFAPVNNCLNTKEHQTPVQKLTANTAEKTSEYNITVNPFARVQNLQEADVIIQKQNNSGIWTVQNSIASNTFSNYFVNTQNISVFKSHGTISSNSSDSFAQLYNLADTKMSDAVNVTATINEANVKSTTVIKDQPIADKLLANSNDSESSSSSDSVFLCPSCHCDGECSKLQSESEYRNALKSKNDNKHLTADEIRAQMRQLFVQLAELEPQKDPYLTDVESSRNIQIDSANVNDEKKGNFFDIFASDQRTKPTNFELAMSDSSLESFGNYFDTPNAQEISTFAKYRENIPASSVTAEAIQDELSSTRLTKLNDICRQSFPFVEYSPKEKLTSQFAYATNLLNEETPVRDICSTTVLKHTGCSNKPLEFQNDDEESQIGNVPPSVKGKLIDAPTPEGYFIESATAPVENYSHVTAKTAVEESICRAVEQHRLIQLHCSPDSALAENMNILYEMGFRNFYGNLQLLKAHENNIVLVLEQLLPRF